MYCRENAKNAGEMPEYAPRRCFGLFYGHCSVYRPEGREMQYNYYFMP